MHDDGLPTMSADTSGSSRVLEHAPVRLVVRWRLSNAALISSTDDLTAAAPPTRSVIEPVGIGTRSDVPSSLPLSSGSTRPIALAAPVLLGMIDSAGRPHAAQVGLAAAGRRGLVLELLVARVGVHRGDEALLDAEACRCSTFAIGARQFVVHDAFEMTVCAAAS